MMTDFVRCTTYVKDSISCKTCGCSVWHEPDEMCRCNRPVICCVDNKNTVCGDRICRVCEYGVSPITEKQDLRYYVEKARE
jgi:hypothetical protein